MAEDLGEKAICIILSGTATDGTLGLRSVKGEGEGSPWFRTRIRPSTMACQEVPLQREYPDLYGF